MKLQTALELGRASNLPTVWSNCLAGALLAGASLDSMPRFAWLILALSLMYLGGMFLNDAFDTDWDKKFKPDRPIARGAATSGEVWLGGFTLLALGPLLLALGIPEGGAAYCQALLSACLLAVAIVAYDGLHKTARFSPWIMGSCRLLVYTTAGLAMGSMTPLLAAGGLCLLAYIVGLTYVARSEHLNDPGSWWSLLLLCAPIILALSQLPDHPRGAIFLVILLLWLALRLRDLLPGPRRNVPAGVGGLLAGIPLVDAALLGSIGAWMAACLALAAFGVTLLLQRWIAGT